MFGVSTSKEVCFEVPAEITSYLSCCSCCSFSLRLTAGTCHAPAAAIEGRKELELFWHPCQMVNNQKSTTQILACCVFCSLKEEAAREVPRSSEPLARLSCCSRWRKSDFTGNKCSTDVGPTVCFVSSWQGEEPEKTEVDGGGEPSSVRTSMTAVPCVLRLSPNWNQAVSACAPTIRRMVLERHFLHFDVFAIQLNIGLNTLFPEDAQRYVWRQSRISKQWYGNEYNMAPLNKHRMIMLQVLAKFRRVVSSILQVWS